MKRKLQILMLVMTFPVFMYGQGRITVTGSVKDGSGEGIPGASIVEKGTARGVISNVDGEFTFSASSENAVLVFSFIGYKTQEVSLSGKTEVNVVLQEDVEMLDEVVVTGYGGSQKRATLTTAISKMDNKVLEKAAFSNVGQALQGTVTGLRVTNTSGQPGTTPNIVLRGGATISGDNNGALIIVDGIVRESMQGIIADDIESVQILKDAASTAIYGARANGGVILIETKKGGEGTSSVSYKFKMGTNFAREGYEFLNAEDYIYYNRLGYKRAGNANVDTQQGYGIGNNLYDIRYLTDETTHLKNEGWSSMADPFYDGRTILFKDYSGKLNDAVFNNSAMIQEHHINFTGGNDKGTFAASLGYFDEDGQVNGTGFKRFSGSVNGSYKVFPFLTVNAGTTYAWFSQPQLWIGSYEMFYRIRSQRPTWNPWLEDGSPASGFGTGDGNPLYYKDKLTRKNGTRNSTYNIGFMLDILPKKLVLSGNASLYHSDFQEEEFDKEYKQQNSNTPVSTRQARAHYRKRNQQQVNATLTYNDTFREKHNLNLMVGGEYFNYHQFNFDATTQGSPTDDIPTLNAGSNRTKTTSDKTGYRILSAFGRANYNYDLKYLLSVTARYDGISRLIDNRWGFFPGVSVGWNIMEEDFWKESGISGVISNLKPRISYGVNGNVSVIGNFDAYGLYGQTDDYDGNTGFYNSTLVNSRLSWEQSQTFEAGLDFSFFNNRLSFIADYYDRRTKDLLTKLDLPSYTGFKNITTNLGTLRNYGIELEVRANVLNLKNGFSWDVTANMSTVANKIVSLPYNGNPKNRQGGVQVWDPGKGELTWLGALEEGGKLGVLYGYKQDHIFKDWEDVKQYADKRIDDVASLYGPGKADEYAGKTGWKPIEPGDVCWADLNEDNIIDGKDRVKVGNIFPNVTGGFSTAFAYKGLALSARFDYALGHTIYNDLLARSLGQYQGTFNVIDKVKDTWSETNLHSDLPKFYYADQQNKKNITRSNNALTAANSNSSRFYEKGDYLALREVTLSYNLPKKWIGQAKMQEASVYVTGQNLCYFTGYSGVSPEPAVSTTYGRGIDNGRYPTPRTLLFGLSVTF